jgi:hypothetical protein
MNTDRLVDELDHTKGRAHPLQWLFKYNVVRIQQCTDSEIPNHNATDARTPIQGADNVISIVIASAYNLLHSRSQQNGVFL